MDSGRNSIFSDFLACLGVPHTAWYSDRQFAGMTFKSLFGLSKLLQSYGVENEAYAVADKKQALDAMQPPYLAYMTDSFVIVTGVSPTEVTYQAWDSKTPHVVPRDNFGKTWSGTVLLAFPGAHSAEPDYAAHRFTEIGNKAKRWVLLAGAFFIFVYLFVSNRIYADVSTVALTVVTLAGLYVTYELMLKSLNIHSERGDAICGILDRTGCHTVLGTSAAKFFGLFGWSEVGISYFGVTLGCLLVFPQYTGFLALINACCCPFSIWSVWYQKYRAKAWCTLCLITQLCLWLSLGCYLLGGWFRQALPLSIEFFVLAASYVVALLGVNAITPLMDKTPAK